MRNPSNGWEENEWEETELSYTFSFEMASLRDLCFLRATPVSEEQC